MAGKKRKSSKARPKKAVATRSIDAIHKHKYRSDGETKAFRVTDAAKRKIARKAPGRSSTKIAEQAVKHARSRGVHTVDVMDIDPK